MNLFRIQIPPIRNRRADISPLAFNFISELSREHNKPITGITPEAINYLQNLDWPGNVRELRNVIETAIILTEDEELKEDDVKIVVENLNEPDSDLHIISQDDKNRLWELIQTGTMSEITAYVTLTRY